MSLVNKESLVWNRLRSGEESALKALYLEFFGNLINYGNRMTVQHELVEDSVQESFVEIWRLRETLSPTDSPKNYLICVFRRILIKKLQSKKADFSEEILLSEADSSADFLNGFIDLENQSEIQKKLHKAMDQLSSRQKEAIYLKFDQGLEYEDICKAMDLQYQSVRNLISTGIQRLREQLSSWIIFMCLLSTFSVVSAF
ncbi:MAG: sigma-70 family RNA polymerase sigma factor [Saprospiraceae bacterium]|nr:sigma-70 family RNA polymerase sigma factor [Saprospiraceae bacterium]